MAKDVTKNRENGKAMKDKSNKLNTLVATSCVDFVMNYSQLDKIKTRSNQIYKGSAVLLNVEVPNILQKRPQNCPGCKVIPPIEDDF